MRLTKTLLLVAVLALPALSVEAEEPVAFRELLERYETIRLALVVDETTGVRDEATALSKGAQELVANFDSQAAGVPEAEGEAGKAMLSEIAAAATRVATAPDLATARESSFELSKPMGRYRKLTGDTSTIVVYCPMAKKDWLQPDGEIGNPYYGSSMPTCGSRVPD